MCLFVEPMLDCFLNHPLAYKKTDFDVIQSQGKEELSYEHGFLSSL